MASCIVLLPLGVGEDKHRQWTPMWHAGKSSSTMTGPPILYLFFSISRILYSRQKPPTHSLTPTQVRPKLFTTLWRAISHTIVKQGRYSYSNSGALWVSLLFINNLNDLRINEPWSRNMPIIDFHRFFYSTCCEDTRFVDVWSEFLC